MCSFVSHAYDTKDRFKLINRYFRECCVYDHTFAFPTLLQQNSLFQNIALCVMHFLNKKIMMGARFEYVHYWCAHHCYEGANVMFEVTLYYTILHEGGTIKTEHLQSPCKLTGPAICLCRRTLYFTLYLRQQACTAYGVFCNRKWHNFTRGQRANDLLLTHWPLGDFNDILDE